MTMTTTSDESLSLQAITKSFSTVKVLKGIDLAIPAGSVTGLVGHNGAGKSTLMRVLSGAHEADSGSVMVNGTKMQLGSPTVALAAGISTVYQELSLLPNLTVMQNVFLGREIRRAGNLAKTEMRQRTRALAERLNLDVDPDVKLARYSVATRQLLEVAIAIERDARYLLLDEPTTSLEGSQVEHFLETVQGLARNEGIGVLFVNHKLDELYAIADHIVALVDGEIRISGKASEVDRESVVQAIAGEEAHASEDGAAQAVARRDVPPSAPDLQPALEIENLHGPSLHGVNLRALPGRVLGIYGLIGAGRTELMRTLVGLDRVHDGTVTLHGKRYIPVSPADAQQRGIVYLTEERKTDGILGGLDATTNVLLPVVGRYHRFGLLDKARMRKDSMELMDRMHVRGDRTAPVERLSGGNQQKVLLARVLAQKPSILLLDEPTKGVDIGVKTEIHKLLRSLAHDDGLTVVVVSSEEEEIIELADDVVTLAGGICDGTIKRASELSVVELRHEAWNAA